MLGHLLASLRASLQPQHAFVGSLETSRPGRATLIATTPGCPLSPGTEVNADAPPPEVSQLVSIADWMGCPVGLLGLLGPLGDHPDKGQANTLAQHAALAGLVMSQPSIHEHIEALTETSTALGTDAFTETVVRKVATVLHTRVAFIATLAKDGQSATTMAFWDGEKLVKPFSYRLAGTPCADVYRRSMCVVPSGVRQRYPDDHMLEELGIEAYVAVPFCDHDGRAFAHLALMHDAPLPDHILEMAAFRVLAAQVGGELARCMADEQRREVERQLIESQTLESLGMLAGNIAHDLNNLLVGIMGNVSLALEQLPASSPARQALADADGTAERAADLMRQLLAYSGRGSLEVADTDLSVLVAETSKQLSLSLPKKVIVQLDLDHGLPRVAVDPAQIRQVLMHLVLNAAQAIGDDSGLITLRTRAEPASPKAPARVGLEVQDSGCGMEAAVMARIFEPYFTTKPKGTGLGLAAVQGIVRGHRGSIDVRSTQNEGTTFTLMLPASQAVAAPALAKPTAPAPPRPGRRALVIDDDPMVRQVTVRILESVGFTAVEADSGERGIELVRADHDGFDIVLLDMTMPGMDGAETLVVLRQLDTDMPVLLISGYSQHDAMDRIGSEGPTGFLQKPFRVANLVAKISEILG